jgi:hypothetical protein
MISYIKKSNIALTGKHVSGIVSSCGSNHALFIFGSNFSYTTWGKTPFTNKPLRTLKNIYKIDHEHDEQKNSFVSHIHCRMPCGMHTDSTASYEL